MVSPWPAGCSPRSTRPTPPREIHSQLLDAGASRLVTVTPFLETALAAVGDTAVRDVYLLDGGPDPATPDTPAACACTRSPTWSAQRPTVQQVPVRGDDIVVLPYSSGTTGVSKGVMLSHRNLVANIAQVVAGADLHEDETLIAVLPFFHIYGMQVIMNCGLRIGATVITMPRFDLEQFLELHQRYGVTRSFVAPPIVVAMAKHPLVDSYDLSALRQVFSGAAPLSAELALAAGTAARLRGGAGLRHDRDVPGLPPDPARTGRARLGGSAGLRHRDAHRRPGRRRRLRARRGRRSLDQRPAEHARISEQPPGHRADDRRAGVAAHRRHRPHRFTTVTCSSSTGSRSSSSTRASRSPRPSWRPCC